MMPTTSLKLNDELKERVAAAAERVGVSPHAFMVDAIRDATDRAEGRARFVVDALDALRESLESGKGYDADEVHRYLTDRVTGKSTSRPKAKTWRS